LAAEPAKSAKSLLAPQSLLIAAPINPMAHHQFDAIVLGIGGMGSAALCELASRGHRVLGLEQFGVGHASGSSHGHSRIIRRAYYEHPDYVPLVSRAFERWQELEQRQGRRLLTPCPCLSIGPPDGELLTGVREAAATHSLAIESIAAADLARRYPGFRFDGAAAGVLEHSAGILFVDDCVAAHVAEAQRHGAIIRVNEEVEFWQVQGDSVVVHTRQGRYTASRLVLTAGPWASRVLGLLGVSLRVMRQVVFWVGTTDERAFRPDVFPIFIADTPEGYFYGLPAIDGQGVKVAQHYGAPELPRPAEVERTVTTEDETPVRQFLQAHLPSVDGPTLRSSVCIYTLTPDRHFLIDVHPDHPQVVIAAGFSGHGFKFASVVGEILADLCESGKSSQPIGRFVMRRLLGRAD
jgi:sarcosine oxidase